VHRANLEREQVREVRFIRADVRPAQIQSILTNQKNRSDGLNLPRAVGCWA
jgi:hypothetical protein